MSYVKWITIETIIDGWIKCFSNTIILILLLLIKSQLGWKLNEYFLKGFTVQHSFLDKTNCWIF